MSKVTTSDIFVRRDDGSIPAPSGRALLKHSNNAGRKLSSDVTVYRSGAAGDKAFQACIRIGGGTRVFKKSDSWQSTAKRASGFTSSCGHGRNPREALKHALQRQVREISKRRGAFA